MDTILKKNTVDEIESLVRKCGDIIRNADRNDLDTDAKAGHANFVTKYDALVQDKLKNGLKEIMPGSGFFGEEGEHNGFPKEEYVFIVDPIDGTTNFMNDLGFFCIAVALVKNKERIFGMVYDIARDELYKAVKGEGAFLNGRRIYVSKKPLSMDVALFGTAPYYEGLPDIAFKKAREYLDKCIDVRRFGSAEMDLCMIAAGKAGIYFEPRLQPWDVAAGSVIVEEAGGTVKKWNGSEVDIEKQGSCVAFGKGVDIPVFDAGFPE